MKLRGAIIINPRSGRTGHQRDCADERVAIARRVVPAGDPSIEIALTQAAGHATILARSFLAAGAEVIVAWGGDGTINEVAGSLLATPAALGIVAAGSGDGVARSLGLPIAPEPALRIALGPSAAAIDVGYLGDRHFLNVAGIGFDAEVGARFNQRAIRGAAGYFAVGLSAVWSYRPESYVINLDGRSMEGPRFLVAFANGRQYGNGLVLAPAADPRDGLLDAVIVDSGTPFRQLWRARRMGIRRHAPAQGLHRFRVQAASVSGLTLACHVDGETFQTSGTLNVRLEPRRLLVKG